MKRKVFLVLGMAGLLFGAAWLIEVSKAPPPPPPYSGPVYNEAYLKFLEEQIAETEAWQRKREMQELRDRTEQIENCLRNRRLNPDWLC